MATAIPFRASVFLQLLLVASFLLLLGQCSAAEEPAAAAAAKECGTEDHGECHNKPEALRLKVIAIATILVASMMGISLPLFSRALPALRPDRNLFVLVKAFASGVILSTGFMHVLPDSFDNLRSPCLPRKPWHEFPFTSFVAMVSAVLTLMLDSFATTFYNRRRRGKVEVSSTEHGAASPAPPEMLPVVHGHGHGHGHSHGFAVPVNKVDEEAETILLRNRVIAQVLEMGIVVHSVVIGLGMGASQNRCTIRPLVAALCFHQFFEGMGLGGCILQAEYGARMKAIMAFFFSTTTPFGIALGIGLSNVYSDNSPTALIVIGLLNASSAGLLIYTALVDLLATDFMGIKLQGSVRLQVWAYVATFLGMGGMSLMAKWA